VALNGAPARICTWKAPLDIKQRLERQQEQEWRREQHLFRYIGRRVGLFDSVREENKARAVAEIYLETGVVLTRLTLF